MEVTSLGFKKPADGEFYDIQTVNQNTQLANDLIEENSSAIGQLPTQESGTFIPELLIGGSAAGITYVSQKGKYVRIGDIIYIDLELKLSNKGSGTSKIDIQGLPFVRSTEMPTPSLICGKFENINFPAGGIQIIPQIREEFSVIELYINTSSQAIPLYGTHLTNNSTLKISGNYRI